MRRPRVRHTLGLLPKNEVAPVAAADDLETMRADVCIGGAGIAGVNALHVASRYLKPDQRVVLVDRNDRVGGMWVET